MKVITSSIVTVLFLFTALGAGAAQESSEGLTPPPKVMLIYREFLKPGKGGAPHEKTESAFVQAVTRSKWPTHYLAVNSVTGRSRALFLYPYDSFEAWEKDNAAMQKNTALAAELDRASVVDGELLSDIDASMLRYDEDYSLRAPVDIAHMRYFEISLYRLKPGHRHDWDELVKLVKQGYDRITDVHWAMYEAAYGQEGTTYVVFVPMKSAAEIDRGFDQDDKQFRDALGEDGMKRLADLESAAIEFSQSNLFQFSPKMSYPPDAWVKADPDFWKPKAAAMPAKAEQKPAAKQ
jgi:hypothetical protein